VSYIHAQDEGIKKHTKTETPEPTQITSDRLDAYNDKRMVVFSGNAVAIQGNKTITADRIVMYYKEKSTNHKKTGAMEGTFGELERIEACGHVQITQDKRIA
jgi:lipopolysaccharide export system protein LptA